jgi:hypothetical protein
MKTRTFIALIIYYIVSPSAIAQNNFDDNPLIYYNMRDTNNSVPFVCQLPILELTDPIVTDSLQLYIEDARKNGYGQFEDSNGIYLTMGLNYELDDTANIYIYISAIENYYLQDNMTRIHEAINHFAKDGYKEYSLGAFYAENILVIVHTRQYVSQAELSRFFTKQNDMITLKLYKEKSQRSIGNGINPSFYFPIPLNNNKNYKSPRTFR